MDFIYNDFNYTLYSVIPERAKILDVGCDTGKLGMQIKKNKFPKLLVGIDNNKEALKLAKKYYDCVIYSDLEKIDNLKLKTKKYDCIVLGDVLEHLSNPQKVLVKLRNYLAKDGEIILSVPNIAFIFVRIWLLLGRFDYRETGTLDYTHLRFFTMKSIKKLLNDSGFNNISITGYINKRFINIFSRFLPTLFGYQFLIVAKRK